MRKIAFAFSLIAAFFISSQIWAFDVSMRTEIEGGSKPTIIGGTNLPSGMELTITLSRIDNSYLAQDKVKVDGGEFRSATFSQAGAPLQSGEYTLEISSSLTAFQSLDAYLGKDGKIGDERVIYYSRSFNVEGEIASKSDNSAPAAESPQVSESSQGKGNAKSGGTATKRKGKAARAPESLESIQRQGVAERIDTAFLDRGINVESVEAIGPQRTTLRIRYRLLSRVFVHKVTNDNDLMRQLKIAGFKKIQFDDADGFAYPYKIE